MNGAIAWVSVAGKHRVPLWAAPGLGRTSTIVDTVGTFFFLPLFTCLFVTTAVWTQLRAGRLAPLAPGALSWLDRLPPRRLRRGAVLGAVSLLLLSPVAVVVLVAVDFDGVSGGQFALYKAVFGVILGAVVTPLIALRAMTDAVPAG